MVKNVEIIENEDPSVKELISKTADDLHKKYNKQRKINERFLKKKTPAKMAISILLDVVCVVLLLVGVVVCFSTINTSLNGYMPNFAGYSNLVISSRSMEASGFYVGDVVVTHSVDADSLNIGDKIAFYYDPYSNFNFKEENSIKINKENTKHKYTLTIPQLLGFQTEEIKDAAKNHRKIIFHHIVGIYEDNNGVRWFQTQGSSNGGPDQWWVNECYIAGVQDEGWAAKSSLWLINMASHNNGIWFLIVPAIVLLVILALSFLKNVQIAKLELDCVEEKRKITDPICVRNNVGFQMSKKAKYKILAQANDDEIDDYIKLLWKDGTAPGSIKKYYLRKKVLLNTNKSLLNLNRKCEEMFKNGDKPTDIAKFYLVEKAKIEEKDERVREQLKQANKQKRKGQNSLLVIPVQDNQIEEVKKEDKPTQKKTTKSSSVNKTSQVAKKTTANSTENKKTSTTKKSATKTTASKTTVKAAAPKTTKTEAVKTTKTSNSKSIGAKTVKSTGAKSISKTKTKKS